MVPSAVAPASTASGSLSSKSWSPKSSHLGLSHDIRQFVVRNNGHHAQSSRVRWPAPRWPRFRGIVPMHTWVRSMGSVGTVIVVATFLLVIGADRYKALELWGTAIVAAAAVAYTLLTKSMVLQGMQQAAVARQSLEHAREVAAAEARAAQRSRVSMLRAQADARTASVLIDQPAFTRIETIEANGDSRVAHDVCIDSLGTVDLRFSVGLTIEVFGEEPLRLTRTRVPTPFVAHSQDGQPMRPGKNSVEVGATLDRVAVTSALKQGGWGPGPDCSWELPLELDFTSLSGEVVEHHHLRLTVRPNVFEGSSIGATITNLQSWLSYPHVPERHYRVDESDE